jgi:hypothetical protein
MWQLKKSIGLKSHAGLQLGRTSWVVRFGKVLERKMPHSQLKRE